MTQSGGITSVLNNGKTRVNGQGKVLVTGATGSFGRKFVRSLLDQGNNISRIVIFSRDELKQWEMQEEFTLEERDRLRFFLGDIRDKDRLKTALEGIDTVVHAAALKQVPAAEYNPMEFVKTNVLGAENLIQACLESNVEKVVALSTDKAAAPINLYGATKLCSDKLFIAANNIKGSKDISFSVVRYGNVMGSRGSVIPYFLEKAKTGRIPITDENMTRFNITLQEGVDMVKWALRNSLGGEILVPKIPSYRITDVAEAIAPNCTRETIGIRPGEKIHEEMITESDSYTTIDLGKYYAILPSDKNVREKYKESGRTFTTMGAGKSYNSGQNEHFLSVEDIRKLVKLNIDPNFEINR